MLKMEKIAKKLTDYYMRKGLINEKDTAIYQFGWQVSIEIFISIIASVGIALYLKMFPDVIFCERKEWIGIEERSSA